MLFCRMPGSEWDNCQHTKRGINDVRSTLHQQTIAIWFPFLCVESAVLEIIAVVCRTPLTKLALEHNLCTHEDSSAHAHHTFSPNVIPHLDISQQRITKKGIYWGQRFASLGAPVFTPCHCWLSVDTVMYCKINMQSFVTFLMITGDPMRSPLLWKWGLSGKLLIKWLY